MALIPQYGDEILAVVEPEVVEPEPSKTWALDFKNGRLGGFIDGKEALRQFVLKAINTERYKHVIYSNDYGSELKALIGSSATRSLLEAELIRVVSEAIVYDDRVDSVQVLVRLDGDKAFVDVTVESVSGDTLEEEVAFNV